MAHLKFFAIFVIIFAVGTYGLPVAPAAVVSTASVPTVATIAPYKVTKKFKPSSAAPNGGQEFPVTSTTTTTTTTTTTQAPTTTTTTETVAPEVETAAFSNDTVKEIRLCSCSDVQECNAEADNKIDECKTSCQSHLSSFGDATENYTSCFPDFGSEADSAYKCLNEKVEDFCESNPKAVSYIPKQDYSSYIQGSGVKEDKDEEMKKTDLFKKARNTFVEFRKFKSCVETCHKNHAIACYYTKNCDIALPTKPDLDAIFDECFLYKTAVHVNAMKSCHCLALKHGVKNILGQCGAVASPHLMRKL